MAAIRTEVRTCRWCGRDTSFAVQLVIGGAAQLVTEQRCISADRVLLNRTCEPQTISVGSKSRNVRRKR